MAVLPAPAARVDIAAPSSGRGRTALLVLAGVALVLAVVPPISTVARHYEFVETVQFDLVAFALPVLLVLGWPLRGLGHGSGMLARLVRLADGRRRHPAVIRSLGFAFAFVGVVVAWRTPGLMDALQRHPWLLPIEIVSVFVTGVPLWAELVRCPPLEPRTVPPSRAIVSAFSMWGVWVLAYLVGFSEVSWYVAFHHVAGGLGATADQELSTAALWLGAGSVFVPRIFADLLAWLRNGEDPDSELRALVRRERRWGPPD